LDLAYDDEDWREWVIVVDAHLFALWAEMRV
jgi:hypothetical protein